MTPSNALEVMTYHEELFNIQYGNGDPTVAKRELEGLRRRALGFNQCLEVVEHSTSSQLNGKEKFIKECLVNYPTYLPISDAAIIEICQSNDFVVGRPEDFVGSLPDRALYRILALVSKLKEHHQTLEPVRLRSFTERSDYDTLLEGMRKSHTQKKAMRNYQKKGKIQRPDGQWQEAGIYVIAPPSMFNMKSKQINADDYTLVDGFVPSTNDLPSYRGLLEYYKSNTHLCEDSSPEIMAYKQYNITYRVRGMLIEEIVSKIENKELILPPTETVASIYDFAKEVFSSFALRRFAKDSNAVAYIKKHKLKIPKRFNNSCEAWLHYLKSDPIIFQKCIGDMNLIADAYLEGADKVPGFTSMSN